MIALREAWNSEYEINVFELVHLHKFYLCIQPSVCTGRGSWGGGGCCRAPSRKKIVLFGQNWCTVRAKTQQKIFYYLISWFIFMVLYFRNVDLDLPKIFALFWTPVLSRYGEENLTSWKNHLVPDLWQTSLIRGNYVQPPHPQQNFSHTPMYTALVHPSSTLTVDEGQFIT